MVVFERSGRHLHGEQMDCHHLCRKGCFHLISGLYAVDEGKRSAELIFIEPPLLGVIIPMALAAQCFQLAQECADHGTGTSAESIRKLERP